MIHAKFKGLLKLSIGKQIINILFEIALVIIFLQVYNVVRNLFGSQACEPSLALEHAKQIIGIERALGIDWEQEIQQHTIRYKTWIRMWNVFYGSAHMTVTVFVLAFLFILKPAAYQRCRTTFLIMNTFALITYALYPLMPPRLMNDCEDKFGGCSKAYSFVDTLEVYGGFWSWRHSGIAKITNHYAAMPSMHAGYAFWCSLSMYEHSPFLAFRIMSIIYPILAMYCIVITGNHFFLDAIFAAVIYCVSHKLSPYFPKVGRGACLDSQSGSPVNLLPTLSSALLDEESPDSLLPIIMADIEPAPHFNCIDVLNGGDEHQTHHICVNLKKR